MRHSILAVLTLALGTLHCSSTCRADSSDQADNASKPPAYSLSVSGNFYNRGEDYAQPTLTADFDKLHLETRYNYEALNSGSTWIGYNLSAGEVISWQGTPMFGAVFGHMQGVGPGYESTLTWQRIQLYSEGEYIIETQDSADSYFYTWTTLMYAFTDWLQAGGAAQRSHQTSSETDLERGLAVAITWGDYNFSASVLEINSSNINVSTTLGVNF